MRAPFIRNVIRGAAALAIVGASSCTMHDQEAPALSGPSEFATSVSVGVSPDILSQDGASQSMVTVLARDADGAPLRSLSLRAEILVNGLATDFGNLSARNIVTGADGQATLMYTAPPAPAISPDTYTMVAIAVTPIGTNYANASTRNAFIRLVPPGLIVPPSGLNPSFTVSSVLTDSQPVLFDASASSAGNGNYIATYAWDYGDGRSGTGMTSSHSYGVAGTYVVTLTITDGIGRSAQKSTTITVSAGSLPTAVFSMSPTDPFIYDTVFFNASGSSATPGRRIVSYKWDFGDGEGATGQTASHPFGQVRTYTVSLTVTDDSGKTATTTNTVAVKPRP